MRPDRHQATVRNKDIIMIGTSNVRTLLQCGKLENLKQEMKRFKINILGVCETRLKGNGYFQSDNFRMIYAGGEKHEIGVGILLDEERNKSLISHWQITERVMLVKLKGNPFNISIIMVYAPTSDSTDEEIE